MSIHRDGDVSVSHHPRRRRARHSQAGNSKVGKVAGTGSFRTASQLPLRGMILIGYFTLMRPINNRALTWEEVTLDPLKGTGEL